jgi:single-stranded DNA-binding protein
VLVIGRLDIGHYQGKDGEQRTSFDVWADDVQAMSTRGAGGGEPFGMDADADGPEPALAGSGVSSGSAASAARGSGSNGKPVRSNARTDSPSSTGNAAADLEDLPF